MRHAKSDWGDASLGDRDRELNKRGRKAAPLMARWLESEIGLPDLILASSAVRVQQTVQLMTTQWSQVPEIDWIDELYLAAPETIARYVQSDSRGLARVMVVGHNPGMEIMASQLAGENLAFPTAAIAVFQWPADNWDAISFQQPAERRAYCVPRSLSE